VLALYTLLCHCMTSVNLKLFSAFLKIVVASQIYLHYIYSMPATAGPDGRDNMIIRTYEDALLAVALKLTASEIEFPAADLTIKPTDFLRNPVTSTSRIEGAILDRQSAIHFE